MLTAPFRSSPGNDAQAAITTPLSGGASGLGSSGSDPSSSTSLLLPVYHIHDFWRHNSSDSQAFSADSNTPSTYGGGPWGNPGWGFAIKFADNLFLNGGQIATVGLSPRFPGWSDLSTTGSYLSGLQPNSQPADSGKPDGPPADSGPSIADFIRALREGGEGMIGPMAYFSGSGDPQGPGPRPAPFVAHAAPSLDVVANPADSSSVATARASTNHALQVSATQPAIETLGLAQVRIPIIEYVSHPPLSSAAGSNNPVGPLGGAHPAMPAPDAGDAASAPARELPRAPGETVGAESILASPQESDILTQILPFQRASLEHAIDRFFDQFSGMSDDLLPFEDSLNLVPASMAFAVAISASGIALWLYRRPRDEEAGSNNSRSVANGDEAFSGLAGPWSWSEL